MPDTTPHPQHDGHSDRWDELGRGADNLTVPPALIGFLLLVAVMLACVFYVAAQVVHTP